jgi:hypothetical protein
MITSSPFINISGGSVSLYKPTSPTYFGFLPKSTTQNPFYSGYVHVILFPKYCLEIFLKLKKKKKKKKKKNKNKKKKKEKERERERSV